MHGPRRHGPSGWDEALRLALLGFEDARTRLTSPRFRFEARRKAFHVLGAVVAVPVLLLLDLLWALAVAAVALTATVVAYWITERRHSHPPHRGEMANLMEPVEALAEPIGEAIRVTRRPGETFPWAPVSFLLALMAVAVAVAVARLPLSFAFAAYGILGFGDAASALIGVAYGRHRLRWNARKSWEGLAAGAVAGLVAAVTLGALYYAWIGVVLPRPLLLVFAGAAVVAAFVESLPGQQDNWTVPVASLATMMLAAWVLGV